MAKKIIKQGNCFGVSCRRYSYFSPKQKIDCPFMISICNGCINTAGQIKEVEACIAVKEGESCSSLYKPLEVERLSSLALNQR